MLNIIKNHAVIICLMSVSMYIALFLTAIFARCRVVETFHASAIYVSKRQRILPMGLYILLAFLTFGLMPQLAVAATDCAVQSDIPQTECEALIDLYNSTNGASWTDSPSNGWNQNNSPCSWTGVACTGSNVTGLYRGGQNLDGTIPAQIDDLTALTELYAGNNLLTGSIPVEITNLTALQNLYLNDNQLSGSIPTQIGNLTGLQNLSLGGNLFTGPIPIEIGSLTALQTLYLYSNQLSGSIPTQIGSLTNLAELGLDDNQLTGSIPAEIGSNLTLLTHLYLNQNQLTGAVPSNFSNLTALVQLGLSANQLSGALPAGISNLTSLTDMWVVGNQFSGTIPDLSPLTVLTGLSLGYNAFTAETGSSATAIAPSWADTQTVPPTAGLSATALSDTEIQVNWTPITYQAGGGYYEVKYSTAPGGPYVSGGTTADKAANTLTVTGLTYSTQYYFVVETYTPAHVLNQNALTSVPSAEISATTMCSDSITITNANDSGPGSLRQAIADICPGGRISSNTNYTINLSSPLTIDKDVMIYGPWNWFTLDGGNAVRIFDITAGNVVLYNMTLTNGNTAGSSGDNGGGINHTSTGTLILKNMDIDSNQAAQDGGGIYNAGGTVEMLRNVTVSNNTAAGGSGGGIRNSGTLILSESTVESNTGASGGAGIHSDGTGFTEITDSRIRFNNGSGIYHDISSPLAVDGSAINDNTGFGIDSYGVLTVTNTTIYANDTGIFKRDNAQTGTANNVTVAGNTTDGIFIEGPTTDLTVRNTIVADNGTNCSGNTASVTSAGYNLENTATCNFVNTGDLPNTSPSLDSFQDNGGPAETMLLLGGSFALEAGDNATCMSTDQRGIPRPQGAACDIGAAEMLPACPSGNIVYVDKTATGANDGSDWTNAFNELQSAMSSVYLDNCTGITEIHVAQGAYTPGQNRSDTFQLRNGVAVYGGYPSGGGARNPDPATNGTVLNGEIGTAGIADNSYHVVSSANGTDSSAILDGFTVRNGNANLDIGGDCWNINADACGGGMSNHFADPTVSNVLFTTNTAAIEGGGVYNRSSDASFSNVTLSANTAADGGGMFNFDGYPTMSDCLFDSNTATSDGGGLVHFRTDVTLNNVAFIGNQSSGVGGGMRIWGGLVANLNNVLFSGNHTGWRGGGLYSQGTTTLTNVSFSGNNADNQGGGIYSGSDNLTLQNTILWGNSAGTAGTEDIKHSNATPGTASYSLIKNSGGSGSAWWAANNITDNGSNIDADPLFTTPVPAAPSNGGDLHLQLGSPAVDTGSSTGCPATDLDGSVRPQNCGVCDMGAYEQLQSPEIQVLDGSTDIPDNTGTVSFGTTLIGTPVTKTFTVKNIGTGANLSLSNLTVPSGFSIVSSFGSSEVSAGGSTSFQIQMNAGAAGTQSGTLQFNTNDYCDENPFDFTVSGVISSLPEPEISLRQETADIASGDAYDFGSVPVGDENAKIFTVENIGGADLNLTGMPKIQLSGAADFILNDTATSPVAPSGNTSFTITFAPSSTGVKTAFLSIPSNDSDENPYTVILNGEGTNTPPAAANDAYSTSEDMILNVAAPGLLANDTDANSDALTSVKVSDPAHGSVALNADGSFTYTPDADYNGTDSFTYKANDGTADSDIAVAEIAVAPVSDAYQITGQVPLNTLEETALTIELNHLTVSDPDNSYPEGFTLTVQDGSNYTRSGNTVTPDTDFNGNLTVLVEISEGTGDSSVFNLTVIVTPVNDAPVLDNSGEMTLTQISGDETEPAGNLVRQIIDSSAANGGDAITDADTDADQGIAVISASNTNGTWQYRLGNESWRDIVSAEVSETNALLLRADDSVRFVPHADYEGTDTETITFCAWDQTSGKPGEYADVSVRGGTTAFSLNDETASLAVSLLTDISGKITYFSSGKPVSDVALTLYGGDGSAYTAVTDEDGHYTVSGVFRGACELSPSKSGDPGNEGLSGEDASKIARYAVGAYEFDEYQLQAADVNQSGRVTILDASDLARYQVGLIPGMNRAENHWIFDPGVRTYSDPDDLEAQNFVAVRLGDVSGSWDQGALRNPLRNPAFKRASSITAAPGDRLTFPIILNGGTEIEGIDIRIAYDREMLEVADLSLAGGILEYEDYRLVANTAGLSLTLFAASEPLFTGDGIILFLSFDVVGTKSRAVIEFTGFQCNESPVSDGHTVYGKSENLSGGFYLDDTVWQRVVLSTGANDAEFAVSQYDLSGDGRIGAEDAVLALRNGDTEGAIRVLQFMAGKSEAKPM